MGEALVAVAVLLVVTAVGLAVWQVATAGRRTTRKGWDVFADAARSGVIEVGVRQASTGKPSRLLGRVVVARIPDDAPDWAQQVEDAKAEARQRAAALNEEGARR